MRAGRLHNLGRLAVLLVAGCTSTGPNSGPLGGLFNIAGSSLLPEAKEFRATVPQPLPVPRELDKGVLAAYVVEPGDSLLIQPVDLDSPIRLPSDQTVLPDGRIDLGKYGRLQVAGQTVDAIEQEVQAAVKAKSPEAGPINVRLVGRQSKVYYVLGQVNAPGSFPLTGRETVLDGLVAAGGLNAKASRNSIILSRPTGPESCRVVLPVCYKPIVQLGDTTTNYQLQPGDRIYVPSQGFCESLTGADKKDCTCKGPQTSCFGAGCGGPGTGLLTKPAAGLPAPILVPTSYP